MEPEADILVFIFTPDAADKKDMPDNQQRNSTRIQLQYRALR